MKHSKFMLFGEDKEILSLFKNALVANGYVFIGYSGGYHNILRHIRSCCPELVVIEVSNRFSEITGTLEVLDEELLAACVLVLKFRNNEVINFLRNSRIITYITKPAFDEAILQIADLTLMNYERVLEYEQKVRKLNDTIESRKLIEKAKWILVEKEGCTELEAYELIRKKSRNNRIPMKKIAEAIILANE